MINSIIKFFSDPIDPICYTKLEKLMIDKANFEERLRDVYRSEFGVSEFGFTGIYGINVSRLGLVKILNKRHKIYYNQDLFFVFCYYLGYISENDWLNALSGYKYRLPNHIFDIDGYSPVGSLIISDINIVDKRKYICCLLKYGIIPTSKDLMLNNLILYNNIPYHIKWLILLLFKKKDFLNSDIRRHIINIWLSKIKSKYCFI